MKKLLYIVGWLVFFTPLVQAEEYDGIWENITDKNSCNLGKIDIDDSYSYLFNDDLVISNNIVKLGSSKSVGKVKNNKVGINTPKGNLAGKIEDNTLSMKFAVPKSGHTAMGIIRDTVKALGTCNYQFVKVDLEPRKLEEKKLAEEKRLGEEKRLAKVVSTVQNKAKKKAEQMLQILAEEEKKEGEPELAAKKKREEEVKKSAVKKKTEEAKTEYSLATYIGKLSAKKKREEEVKKLAAKKKKEEEKAKKKAEEEKRKVQELEAKKKKEEEEEEKKEQEQKIRLAKLVQDYLQILGFYTDSIDGLFGKSSILALNAWQLRNGLELKSSLDGITKVELKLLDEQSLLAETKKKEEERIRKAEEKKKKEQEAALKKQEEEEQRKELVLAQVYVNDIITFTKTDIGSLDIIKLSKLMISNKEILEGVWNEKIKEDYELLKKYAQTSKSFVKFQANENDRRLKISEENIVLYNNLLQNFMDYFKFYLQNNLISNLVPKILDNVDLVEKEKENTNLVIKKDVINKLKTFIKVNLLIEDYKTFTTSNLKDSNTQSKALTFILKNDINE